MNHSTDEQNFTPTLSLLCDLDGRLVQVQRDDLKITGGMQPGAPLSALIDPPDQAAAEKFLHDIRQRKARFDCQMTVHAGGYKNRLHFVGGLAAERNILIIASPSNTSAVTALFDEMMRIANEQTNQLRSLLKERALLQKPQKNEAQEAQLYSELTRLNNDLVDAQRQLAKKNRELSIERERYRIISETTSDFIYAMRVDKDFDLQTEWTAGALEKIIGYDANELQRMGGLQALTLPEDRPLLEDQRRRLERGEKAAVEVRVTRRDGSLCWLRDYKKPVWDEKHKRVTRIFGAMQDISEQKKVETALLSNQKMSDLGTLTAGIAHEISSPLQVIAGIGDNLLEKVRQDQFDRQNFEQKLLTLSRSAWRLADLINTLRNYAGAPPRSYQDHDLNEIVKETILLLGHQFERGKNIRVVTELAPSPLTIQCEYSQIVQALINLLNNAQEAMPQGGQISIRTASVPGQFQALLEVSDSGEGIAWENQEKIFAPFFTTKPPGPAKGLGLWVVAGIVQAHGGRIEVHSEPGKGATFKLFLPVRLPAALTKGLSQRDSGRFSD